MSRRQSTKKIVMVQAWMSWTHRQTHVHKPTGESIKNIVWHSIRKIKIQLTAVRTQNWHNRLFLCESKRPRRQFRKSPSHRDRKEIFSFLLHWERQTRIASEFLLFSFFERWISTRFISSAAHIYSSLYHNQKPSPTHRTFRKTKKAKFGEPPIECSTVTKDNAINHFNMSLRHSPATKTDPCCIFGPLFCASVNLHVNGKCAVALFAKILIKILWSLMSLFTVECKIKLID